MEGRKDKRGREIYGGPAREEWGGIWPYVYAGVVYIVLGQFYPGILYSFMTGTIFLLVCLRGVPWLWRKVTRADARANAKAEGDE